MNGPKKMITGQTEEEFRQNVKSKFDTYYSKNPKVLPNRNPKAIAKFYTIKNQKYNNNTRKRIASNKNINEMNDVKLKKLKILLYNLDKSIINILGATKISDIPNMPNMLNMPNMPNLYQLIYKNNNLLFKSIFNVETPNDIDTYIQNMIMFASSRQKNEPTSIYNPTFVETGSYTLNDIKELHDILKYEINKIIYTGINEKRNRGNYNTNATKRAMNTKRRAMNNRKRMENTGINSKIIDSLLQIENNSTRQSAIEYTIEEKLKKRPAAPKRAAPPPPRL